MIPAFFFSTCMTLGLSATETLGHCGHQSLTVLNRVCELKCFSNCVKFTRTYFFTTQMGEYKEKWMQKTILIYNFCSQLPSLTIFFLNYIFQMCFGKVEKMYLYILFLYARIQNFFKRDVWVEENGGGGVICECYKR